MEALINRLFGIPVLDFNDDVVAHIPSLLGRMAMRAIKGPPSVGDCANGIKSQWRNSLSFFSSIGDFPNRPNRWAFRISLTPAKATRRAAQSEDSLRDGQIPIRICEN